MVLQKSTIKSNKKRKGVKMKEEKLLYSVSEAAKIMGVSYSWLDRLVRDGKVESIRMGGKRMIRKTDIDLYVKEGI